MGERYHQIAYGPHALARQRRAGSHVVYGDVGAQSDSGPDELGDRELAFLRSTFQFHLATVTDGGWPYIQYRSGPRGFVHHLGGNRIGFADFDGNSQFVTVGNIEDNHRVALFLADYPRRMRLKLFGHATVVDDDDQLLDELATVPDGRVSARAERSILIDVEGIDWNCSRSLVPQYDRDYVRKLNQANARRVAELEQRIRDLEAGERE